MKLSTGQMIPNRTITRYRTWSGDFDLDTMQTRLPATEIDRGFEKGSEPCLIWLRGEVDPRVARLIERGPDFAERLGWLAGGVWRRMHEVLWWAPLPEAEDYQSKGETRCGCSG